MSNESIDFINLFEKETDRVKGMSFHPTRPWILIGLHNGSIQLWDYRIKTLIEKFNEHSGPVRSVAFHPSQQLFVSGGDDYKVRVWNYKERRCLFTYDEHIDYVRTVQFHHEYPWVLSASDDYTIRILNWQSRQTLSILVGHNHYVMCAQFHPTEDLIVSSSLDGTIRIWDISALRKKAVVPYDDSMAFQLQNELLGGTDGILKFIIENENGMGVNWVTFQSNNSCIASGSDDRTIKLWRYNESRLWDYGKLTGHYHNVVCCVYHPSQEMLISCGEDKTLKIWNISKKKCIYTYRRDERFWIVISHPERNIFAAGHDSGFILFKLKKERPLMALIDKGVLFIRDNHLRYYDFNNGKDLELTSLRKRERFLAIQFNATKRIAIVISEDSLDNQIYELYALNSKSDSYLKGTGKSPVWVTFNRFVFLDQKLNQLVLCSEKNEVSKSFNCPVPGKIESLFPAFSGSVLIKVENQLILFDLESESVLASALVGKVKFVYWHNSESNDSCVAVIGLENILLMSSQLQVLADVKERYRIKSGIWTGDGVFLYTTIGHIKYLLPNGDTGIIRTLERPIYMTGFLQGKIFCLDRNIKNRTVSVDTTEFTLKLALIQKRYSDVISLIKTSSVLGKSLVKYLQGKEFPDLALYFAKDNTSRFDLAIECGNLDIALDSAQKIDRAEIWNELSEVAMKLGNISIAEIAYQKVSDFDKLAFLYLITGQINSLKALEKKTQKMGKIQTAYQIALYLGDFPTQIVLLENSGQIPLAYLTAETYGLKDEAERLRKKIKSRRSTQNNKSKYDEQLFEGLKSLNSSGKLLVPPSPLLDCKNLDWPLLNISQGPFDSLLQIKRGDKSGKSMPSKLMMDAEENLADDKGFLDEQEIPSEMSSSETSKSEILDQNEWDVSLDQVDLPNENDTKSKLVLEPVFLPSEAQSIVEIWKNQSNVPGEHVAIGSFETAIRLLNSQLGIVNFEPLKPLFLKYQSSLPKLNIWHSEVLETHLSRSPDNQSGPFVFLKLNELIKYLQHGYKSFTMGKFQESIDSFKQVLCEIPLLVLQSDDELMDVKELIEICSEYILGLQFESRKKELIAPGIQDFATALSLAAYFTQINLQGPHLQLVLRSAMNFATKLKCYGWAYSFGRRLLQIASKPDIIKSTQKLLQLCEDNNLNDAIKIDYDEKNPCKFCCGDHVPIYQGNASISCPYCGSRYLLKYESKLCKICELAKIGTKATGLTLIRQKTTSKPKDRIDS